MLISMIMMTC